ncbi:uncharacterized protein LTR77_009853 [Saxophila tyrrhenica]|uniref:FAD/NAD(P)-binding domain-containing protein n=1 Tax=Saxophila tyrrhenica TaxID=1690608 RepID=A0AAV9P0T4_9PEZI|nr:hypothetical protein LTR77_009853 [Saxophila tyrrhenica]
MAKRYSQQEQTLKDALNNHPPTNATPRKSSGHARISKVPTGLGAEPLNIVILGASYAGLAVAHHFLDHTINQLRITSSAPNYRLIIVSPSTHLYWNVAGPRVLVSPELVEGDKLFIPLEQALHRHRAHKTSIIQGEAVALDTSARTVTIELIGSTAQKRAGQINKRKSAVQFSTVPTDLKVQTLGYHALIIATGSSAHSDLLSLHGPHLNTLGALNDFHARVEAAETIVVAGGGCSGVETAGQLAAYLNYHKHSLPKRRRIKNPKRILLITGSDRCLPTQPNQAISAKAARQLGKLGVEPLHSTRVLAAKHPSNPTAPTRLELSTGSSLLADLYIPCTGVTPNTAFLSTNLKDAHGNVLTNPSTLRLDEGQAGPRVYAIGDCAVYSRNNLQDVYSAIPALMQNLGNDLLAHEYRLASPYGGNQAEIDALEDEVFVKEEKESWFVPIGKRGGVGMAKGKGVPGWVIGWMKGEDWLVKRAGRAAEGGRSPYG